jgi:hypothetical protein
MAGTTGLEPATSGLTGRRSNQLNYVPRRRFRSKLRHAIRTRPGLSIHLRRGGCRCHCTLSPACSLLPRERTEGLGLEAAVNDLVTHMGETALADTAVAPATEATSAAAPAIPSRRPTGEPPGPAPRTLAAPHPAVLVDPRAWTVHVARQLRRRGVPVVVLSPSWLEPACSVRGVRRQHLPPISARPERWQARLLELAATLEPRGAVYACSPAARELLERTHRTLEPHYVLANRRAFDSPAGRVDPDAALRNALSRSEAALEVQMVLHERGQALGAIVLAWAAGAPPDVLVTSVAGTEVLARSEDWLGARRVVGYARLIWSPDRFGRLTLQAASSLPGPGLVLAAADGVDFGYLAHAAACGLPVAAQQPACRLVRRLVCCEAGAADPLEIVTPLGFDWRDPLPTLASFLRGLRRT